MVGLGETMEEMLEAFALLREHEVQVLTVGQYLRPSANHLPLVRYWTPEEFAELEREAYALGFESVASGPLVRSSYHADEQVPVRRAASAYSADTCPVKFFAGTVAAAVLMLLLACAGFRAHRAGASWAPRSAGRASWPTRIRGTARR